MQAIEVDPDGLRDYAGLLHRRAAEAAAVSAGLRALQLDDEVFGEVGHTMRSPQAYRLAAQALSAQVAQLDGVLTAAATALAEAAGHYQGTDFDGARTLERRGAAD